MAQIECVGDGPKNEPFPETEKFSKAALIAAHAQALRKNGSGATYPKPWKRDGAVTEYMEFPIMVDGSLWTGGKPREFRILYKKSDNTFYRVAVHLSATDLTLFDLCGAPVAKTKRDSTGPEDEAFGSLSMRIVSRYTDA
ncbi:hypothetical protein M7I_4420 [Glarea lozoyensis 74030]|uniref:Uncharacterized protein n=1 Tax=Glarea lozoyensis (strain ATCC 74030 / MF5533) TaxID=1104152 RepID=H0EP51_GLAL7|nr:hypothetical protein M7I_4420 [Glarea lozoyensis 74030]